MKTLRLRDLSFDLRTAGNPEGPLVLLLHGFPALSRSYEAVLNELAHDGYHLVAPDQRGYSPGARPTAKLEYATGLLAQDVIDIAQALGHSRFHLVGHDWGASVAWVVAARHPECVQTLTAISVPHLAAYGLALKGDPDQQARAAYIKTFRTDQAERMLLDDDARGLRRIYGGALSAEDEAAYVAHFSTPFALTAALDWYRAMRSDLGELPPVTMPTTYVWGNRDEALGRFGAERCGEYVKADYEFLELDGIGHWVAEEAPNVLAAAIRKRIASTA